MSVGDIRAGRAFVEITMDSAKLIRGVQRSIMSMQEFGAVLTSVGRQLTFVGIAAAAPFVHAVRQFQNFEDAMLAVKAVTGATEEEFDALNQTAKELGRTTSFTAQEVASAMVTLSKAGFTAQESMDAIASALGLARATGTDLNATAKLLISTMNQFGLASTDAAHIADVLTAAANGSTQELADLGEGLKLVAPLAKEWGDSLENVTKILAILANNGIKGSRASTALARAYKNLTDEAKRNTLMDALPAGSEIRMVDELTGKLRPLGDILLDIGKASDGLDKLSKLSLFNKLFGRGQAGALKIADPESFKKVEDLFADLEGKAKKAQNVMESGLGGAFRFMVSAIDGVALAIGQALQPELQALYQSVRQIANDLASWIEKNREVVVEIAYLVAGVVAAGVALTGFGVAITAAATAAGGVVAVLSMIVGAVASIAAAPSFFAIVAALASISAAVLVMGVDFEEAFDKAFSAISKGAAVLQTDVLAAVEDIASALKRGDMEAASEIMWANVKVIWLKNFGSIQSDVEAFIGKVTDTFDSWVKAAEFTATSIDAAFAPIIRTFKNLLGVLNTVDEALGFALNGGPTTNKDGQIIGKNGRVEQSNYNEDLTARIALAKRAKELVLETKAAEQELSDLRKREIEEVAALREKQARKEARAAAIKVKDLQKQAEEEKKARVNAARETAFSFGQALEERAVRGGADVEQRERKAREAAARKPLDQELDEAFGLGDFDPTGGATFKESLKKVEAELDDVFGFGDLVDPIFAQAKDQKPPDLKTEGAFEVLAGLGTDLLGSKDIEKQQLEATKGVKDEVKKLREAAGPLVLKR